MSPTDVRRYSPPVVGVVLPTKQYPYLKDLVKQVDFVCSNCSSAEGYPVYHTLAEAHTEPLGGPGQYTTMFTVYCPTCRTTPTDGDYIHNGIIDLLKVPRGYKRPPRVNGSTAGLGMQFEEEDEPVIEVPEARPVRAKVATPAAKAKKARLRAKRQRTKLA